MFVNYFVEKLDHTSSEVAKKIWELFQLGYQVEADLLQIRQFPPLERSCANIGMNDSEFFGIWVHKVLIASIEISKVETTLLIDSLVVNPEYFRQGFATALLTQVLNKFSCEEFRVNTAAKNVHALALYKKVGFVESGSQVYRDSIECIELIYRA
ncbi:MAG: GNAT family N-acetyltransferase [Gammaproteobacteria bacterium]|nr:GNAT family N-acetyltransferase [Gammaproteobacteria bacterium]